MTSRQSVYLTERTANFTLQSCRLWNLQLILL